MNFVLNESLYFFRSNFKLLTLFVLPFALFSIAYEIIGIVDPKSSINNIIYSIYSIFIYPIHIAFVFILIAKIANKESISFLQILKKALTFWVPLFLVTLLTSIIIAGGLIVFIIPGIWIFLRLILAPLYVLFEGLSASKAINIAYNDSKAHLSTFFFSLFPFIVTVISFFFVFNDPTTTNYFSTILYVIIFEYVFVLISIVQYRLYTLFVKNS